MTFLSKATTSASSLWLGAWASDSLSYTPGEYIWVYAVISLGTGLLIFGSGMLFNYFARASANSL